MIESAAIAGDSVSSSCQQIAQCIVTEEISCSVGSLYNPVCIHHDSIICFQFVDGSGVRCKIERREHQTILFNLGDASIPHEQQRRVRCGGVSQFTRF